MKYLGFFAHTKEGYHEFGFSWLWCAWDDKGFWFRVFGRGLRIDHHYRRPMLFSMRYGYQKYWRIGHYRISALQTFLLSNKSKNQ